MKERVRKTKIGLRDKCKDAKEMVMKIEGEWGKMFRVCACVCVFALDLMELRCSCNIQRFDCQGGNRAELSFCVLTFFPEELFFFFFFLLFLKGVNNQK